MFFKHALEKQELKTLHWHILSFFDLQIIFIDLNISWYFAKIIGFASTVEFDVWIVDIKKQGASYSKEHQRPEIKGTKYSYNLIHKLLLFRQKSLKKDRVWYNLLGEI